MISDLNWALQALKKNKKFDLVEITDWILKFSSKEACMGQNVPGVVNTAVEVESYTLDEYCQELATVNVGFHSKAPFE